MQNVFNLKGTNHIELLRSITNKQGWIALNIASNNMENIHFSHHFCDRFFPSFISSRTDGTRMKDASNLNNINQFQFILFSNNTLTIIFGFYNLSLIEYALQMSLITSNNSPQQNE